jgi:hypothetical protein
VEQHLDLPARRLPRRRRRRIRVPVRPPVREGDRGPRGGEHGVATGDARRSCTGERRQAAPPDARAAESRPAQVELKQKGAALGVAGGLGAGAAAFVFYAIGFGFASAAAGLAEALPLWAALLIVTGVLLLAAGILGFLAVRSARRAAPPEPELAVAELRKTLEAVGDRG